MTNPLTLWHVPIEPIETRYSSQWLDWFPRSFKGVENRVVLGEASTGKVSASQWLDPAETISYKATQVAAICEAVSSGILTGRDVFFFYDAWFPGIEGLAYLKEMAGRNFRLVGYLHAGTWDAHDQTAKNLNPKWARGFEELIFKVFDKLFVATEFHKSLILKSYPFAEVTVIPFGFDWASYDQYLVRDKEKNLCVFPHRLADEKRPDKLRPFCERYSLLGEKTLTTCPTKEAYLKRLGQAEYSVSFALQETFGISMLESAYLGARPIVPDRLSYKEVLPEVSIFYAEAQVDSLQLAPLTKDEMAATRKAIRSCYSLEGMSQKIIKEVHLL